MNPFWIGFLGGLLGAAAMAAVFMIMLGRSVMRAVKAQAAETIKADQVAEDPDPCAVVTVYRKDRAERGLSPMPWVEKALADLDPGPGLRPSIARTLALLSNESGDLVLIRDLKLRHGAT